MSFINEILPHAKKVGKEFNILVSLILAQAIHESNWGKSGLATKGFNLFGIKGTYNGQFVTMKTWEVYNGKSVYVDANFRKYPSWYESLKDLANLYQKGVSWDRNKYKKVIGEKDYKAAAKAVQAAGYATDPDYATKLIKTIESNKLTQYDSVEEKTVKPAEEKVSAEIVTTPNKPSTAKKVIKTYKVKNGDALSKLASKWGTTVKRLQELNNIKDPNKIYIGQTLKYEASGSVENIKQYHTVVKGDNVTKIAKKYSTTVAAIKKLNPNIKDINKIYPKQKIRIK
ncbi:glucosaminidase domain-containing protein [Cytobacillus oceanisediminis]|uniref:glucosaminidase domain-containing protein n=1 Tax=Cytobacillus oceanisediminis TaxID=665099 RepID=UPI00398D0CA6